MRAKIGIIADTVTDTKMGKDFFESKGYKVVMCPVKENSLECVRFFQQPPEERNTYISALVSEIKTKGVKVVVVYANSICEYVDIDKLCAENGMIAITPFHAYKKLGKIYQKPCVWAATIGALSGIENRLTESNHNIEVCGFYNLSVAVQIETGLSPSQIINKNGLKELAVFSEKAGCDCIILGCTHFPYFMDELHPYTSIPIIDPADIMLDILYKTIEKQRKTITAKER